MLPCWNPKNIKRRLYRLHQKELLTCPSSCHVEIMARSLLSTGKYHMFDDEPVHCAGSLLIVCEQLYKARRKIRRLERRASK